MGWRRPVLALLVLVGLHQRTCQASKGAGIIRQGRAGDARTLFTGRLTRLKLRGGSGPGGEAALEERHGGHQISSFGSSELLTTEVGRGGGSSSMLLTRETSASLLSDEAPRDAGEGCGVKVMVDRVLGNGTFGTVYEGLMEDGKLVAVKTVLQDPRFRNRELSIMKPLRHPNIVRLFSYFYTTTKGDQGQAGQSSNPPLQQSGAAKAADGGGGGGDVMLNLVMEYVPDTLHRRIKSRSRKGKLMPHIETKVYAWQLLRSLAYLHRRGVCHRDVKPQNLLVDPSTLVAKLCDLGSAKKLVATSTSISYICSRFYRAPELIMGATKYSTEVDMWSFGCVLGEALLGAPLFAGDSSAQQLAAIATVIGVPTPADVVDMDGGKGDGSGGLNETAVSLALQGLGENPHLGEGWAVFERAGSPAEALSLLTEILVYSPKKRKTAIEIMAHPFFDELRQNAGSSIPGVATPNNLFSLTPEEISWAREAGLLDKIIPANASLDKVTPVTSPCDTPSPLASRWPSPGLL